MSNNERLNEIRGEIDKVDNGILELLNQRAKLAIEVGEIKKAESDSPVFYRPEREAQILRKRMEEYQGALHNKDVAQIFRDIMTACLALQQPQTIAFLGPLGTYSHASVCKHFGESVGLLPTNSIKSVFTEVENGNAHYGVVPIENSTTGMIQVTLDMLMHSSVHICGEIILPVKHNLLRHPQDKEPIQKIYSHQQSLMQCKQWLAEHHPEAELIPVGSNAEAAKMLVELRGVAAVAGELAANAYNLAIVAANIEDNPNNCTRFVIIGKQEVLPSGDDKTSLFITTPHEAGSLMKLLEPFAKHNINLSTIESKPYHHQNWSYILFLDIDGHQKDEKVSQAISELSKLPIMYTILGSYPKAVLV